MFLLRIDLMKNQIVLKAFTASMILERYLKKKKSLMLKLNLR